MKPLSLLLLGVVVGWAASGVDWSGEAIGEEPPVDSASPERARIVDAPAREGHSGRPRQWPRRVYETRVTTDSNGARHTEVMSRLVNADGSIVPETTPGLVGQYQVSAYGSPSGHGCYIVDTMTGKTWHVANIQPPRVVAEALSPYAPQPSMPTPANQFAPPLMVPSHSEPQPQAAEPMPERRETDSPPLNTPELAEPTPDAAD